MDFIYFASMVIFLSLSGVLAPGPLFAVTLSEGKKNKFAGIKISVGHATVELPIIISLAFLGMSFDLGIGKDMIALIGGILLLYLAYSEIKSDKSEIKIKGVISGILMSALNPYFIIWWLTVGFSLVLKSIEFGLIGLISLIILHESCDFGWLGFVSAFSNRLSGYKNFSKALSYVSAIILAFFGIYFIYTSTSKLLIYP